MTGDADTLGRPRHVPMRGFANAGIVYALEEPWGHHEYTDANQYNLNSTTWIDDFANRGAQASMGRDPAGSATIWSIRSALRDGRTEHHGPAEPA